MKHEDVVFRDGNRQYELQCSMRHADGSQWKAGDTVQLPEQLTPLKSTLRRIQAIDFRLRNYDNYMIAHEYGVTLAPLGDMACSLAECSE